MVVRVSDYYSAQTNCDVMRMLQLRCLASVGAELVHTSSINIKYLNTMVLLVADIDGPSSRVTSHSPGQIEFALIASKLSKGSDKAARHVEHLDPMIVTIAYYIILCITIDRNSGQAIELARLRAIGAELVEKVAILVENLHPMVRGISHNYFAPT